MHVASSGDKLLSEIAHECWEWHPWFNSSWLAGYYQAQDANWIPRLLATPWNTGIYEDTPQLVWDEEFGSFIPVEMKYPRPHALRISEYRPFVESFLVADSTDRDRRVANGVTWLDIATRHLLDVSESSNTTSPRTPTASQLCSYKESLNIASQKPICAIEWKESIVASTSAERNMTHTHEVLSPSAILDTTSSLNTVSPRHDTFESLSLEICRLKREHLHRELKNSPVLLTGKHPSELTPHLPPVKVTTSLLQFINTDSDSGSLNRLAWIFLLQQWVETFYPLPLAQFTLLKKKSYPQKYALSHGFASNQEMIDFLQVVNELVTLLILLRICSDTLSIEPKAAVSMTPLPCDVSSHGWTVVKNKHEKGVKNHFEDNYGTDQSNSQDNDGDDNGRKIRLRDSCRLSLCKFKLVHVQLVSTIMNLHKDRNVVSPSKLIEAQQVSNQPTNGSDKSSIWSDQETVTFLNQYGSYICMDLVAAACAIASYPAALRFTISLATRDPEVSETAHALLSNSHPSVISTLNRVPSSTVPSHISAGELLALSISARRLNSTDSHNRVDPSHQASTELSMNHIYKFPYSSYFNKKLGSDDDIEDDVMQINDGSVTRRMFLMEELLVRISERTSAAFDKLYCLLLYILPDLLVHQPTTASEVLGWISSYLPINTARWLIQSSLHIRPVCDNTTGSPHTLIWGEHNAATLNGQLSSTPTIESNKTIDTNLKLCSELTTASEENMNSLKVCDTSSNFLRRIRIMLQPPSSMTDEPASPSMSNKEMKIKEMELSFYFNYLDCLLRSLYNWDTTRFSDTFQHLSVDTAPYNRENSFSLKNQNFGVLLLSWILTLLEIIELKSADFSSFETASSDSVDKVTDRNIDTIEHNNSQYDKSDSIVLSEKLLEEFVCTFCAHVSQFESVIFSYGENVSVTLASAVMSALLSHRKCKTSSVELVKNTLHKVLVVSEPRSKPESFSFFFSSVFLLCVDEMNRLLEIIDDSNTHFISENNLSDEKTTQGHVEKAIHTFEINMTHLSSSLQLLRLAVERALDSNCIQTGRDISTLAPCMNIIDKIIAELTRTSDTSASYSDNTGIAGSQGLSTIDRSDKTASTYIITRVKNIETLSALCKLMIAQKPVHKYFT